MRRAAVVSLALILAFAGAESLCRFCLPRPPARLLPQYPPGFLHFLRDLNRPFFRAAVVDGKSVMVPFRRVGVLKGTQFPREKPPGRVRILCVGESTVAFGDFTRFLDAYLKVLWPLRSFEVINAGQCAIGSKEELSIFREVLHYQPDAVVVYMGHNYLARFPSVPPWKLRLLRLADRSLAIRWAASRLRVDMRAALESSWDRQEATKVFRDSLREMAVLARRRHVPLIVCVPASNLTMPPHAVGLNWGAPRLRLEYGRALMEYDARSWKSAAGRFAWLERQDGGIAVFPYYLGLSEEGLGRYDLARASLERSRDLDTNDRASSEVAAAVRRLSRQESFAVADVESSFATAAPHRITGFDSFIDYCHPRSRDYGLIARSVARAAQRSVPGLGPADWKALDRGQAAIAQRLSEGLFSSDAVNSLLQTGYITAMNAVDDPAAFSEETEVYFQRALALDRARSLAILGDSGSASRYLGSVLSSRELPPRVAAEVSCLARLYAGVALRRLGFLRESQRLLERARQSAPGPAFAAAALTQEAVSAALSGGRALARRLVARAGALYPPAAQGPLALAAVSDGGGGVP